MLVSEANQQKTFEKQDTSVQQFLQQNCFHKNHTLAEINILQVKHAGNLILRENFYRQEERGSNRSLQYFQI
ncbi:MAG: hypothetical protein COT22_01425 [Ignavibacteria bacterium CG08_land_8_20_14_0_20_37_9]|nr:MAG: hypothetical protein COT22_01425 [Ignavibacteria bacterium CG08_land_8_20_14_0_20_37_9]PIX92802.1 MAG: hypothetical protein COZ25_13980 [Ignavibacteria bacterium CG_4_10_14_3_um_filter_37_18]PJC60688.1 MAG: hypothetical protein CO025_02525 [Ignavibacteria bacterium CG_4_9_14_0_2_um_filter_37_13]